MDSRSFTFPKGEYFFGDLGYLFPHPNYPSILNDDWIDIFCENDEGDWDYKDKEYLLLNTGGDGYFFNHRGGESLPVDSGSLGLIPTEVVDPEILNKAKGIIFDADHELKIDVQGEAGRTVGFHIYQKREEYFFEDEAILIVIDKDEIDESYFTSKCPKFSDGYEDYVLFDLEEDEEDETELEEEDTNEKVIEKCSREIDANPKGYAPYLERANARKKMGDKKGALKDLLKVVKLDTYEYINFMLEVANLQMELGDKKGALNSLDKGIEKNPTNLFLICKKSFLQHTMGYDKEAIKGLQELISKNKEYAPAHYELGLIQRRLDNHNEVIENYTKALNLSNNNRSLLPLQRNILLGSININYGYQNRNQGYIEMGFEEYEKAIESIEVLFNSDVPLDSFTKEAIYSSPREIYFNRAGDRYLLGDLKGACEDWKKAAELGDEDAVKLLEEHCE